MTVYVNFNYILKTTAKQNKLNKKSLKKLTSSPQTHAAYCYWKRQWSMTKLSPSWNPFINFFKKKIPLAPSPCQFNSITLSKSTFSHPTLRELGRARNPEQFAYLHHQTPTSNQSAQLTTKSRYYHHRYRTSQHFYVENYLNTAQETNN